MASPRYAIARKNASRDSARVAAVTNNDFPRVLNGPAPGYAEDALRRLLFCALPSEEGREISAAEGERGMTIELNTPGLVSQQQHQRAGEDVGWRREEKSGGWRTADGHMPGYGDDGGGAAAAAAWNSLSSGSDEGKGREVREGGGIGTYDRPIPVKGNIVALGVYRLQITWGILFMTVGINSFERTIEMLNNCTQFSIFCSKIFAICIFLWSFFCIYGPNPVLIIHAITLETFSPRFFLFSLPRKGGRGDLKPTRRHHQQQKFAAAGRNHARCGSWRRHQNHQAFSSAPELADCGEYDDYGGGLESMASSHVEDGPRGSEEERRRLPYSTLWTMQLAREEQSHQEACDKYAQVYSHPV